MTGLEMQERYTAASAAISVLVLEDCDREELVLMLTHILRGTRGNLCTPPDHIIEMLEEKLDEDHVVWTYVRHMPEYVKDAKDEARRSMD